MDLNIKLIDISKANLGLRHEYVPQTVFNLSQPEEDRIVVDCEYFRVGERASFVVSMDEDGQREVNFQKVFRKKVKGIRNLLINGKPVTTADEFLKYPDTVELSAILYDVCSHLIQSDSLNEEERKN